MTSPRPGLDPELRTLLAGMPLRTDLDTEALAQIRPFSSAPVEPLLAGRSVDRREVMVAAGDGARIPLSVFGPARAENSADHESSTDRESPADHEGSTDRESPAGAPCVYWMHGGGMVMGDRFSQIDIPLEWLDEFGAVVVSVDYRLAPEATGTTLVEDCYQGLLWIAEHAAELGVDPGRIVVAGASAGGGLAAGVALLARDRGGPALAAQVLICPMLDHRGITVSSEQYAREPGVWTREMNAFGWRSLLGGIEDEQVTGYLSPAVADQVSGLPTTYIDAGSAEVFRDEAVAYATRIWAAGGQAELHVWAGGFHGFDALFPQAPLSVTARRTRTDWLARTLNEERAASSR
ncbi:alpha/beta hydrolase [Streptomyces sp. NBC_01498]|uniref:alpha/beta hydrolase n=1 Tax=Streptomyces sp. NBC_01498 TaxID=2975870 RepID=UPI002E7B95A0|nr:alpha/beta hydrolase [Streptomyces sp. NBC_01498]WTL23172.1 alpha/beta hydrolase [Streptomyces sp. NBC_01498]